MIEYRSYTPTDREAVLRLVTEGMTPAAAAARSATFDWQFMQNPHDDGRSPFLLGIAADGLAGVTAFMPARIIYRGTRRTGIWSCDTYVAASHRGKGIAREMIARVVRSADIVVAYGVSDAAVPLLKGSELSREIAGYSFDIRSRGIRGTLKNLHGRLFRIRQRIKRHTGSEIGSRRDADFGPEVDDLWSRSAPTYDSAIERDAAYLNWKYRRHPLLSYCWYSARKGTQLSGVLIVRSDADTSVIVDYCGPRDAPELIADLVNAAVDDLSNRGTVRVHCETTDACMAAALRQNGFRRLHGEYRFYVRCNCIADPHPSRHFFLMTGDCDNDLTAVPTT